MSPLGKLCLALILGISGLIGYSYTVGKDSLVGTITATMVDEIRAKIGNYLPEFHQANRSRRMEKPEIAYASIRDACFNSMFLEKSGFFFSQSRWGAEPVPYQFRGLEMIGPKSMQRNQADQANGIDKRVRYEFTVEAYRRYVEGEGWESWQFGTPPGLTGITLLRKDGEWQISSAPTESYSIR